MIKENGNLVKLNYDNLNEIGIINYGIGNIRSLYNSIKNLEFEVDILSEPQSLKNYDKFFAWCR